MGSRAMHITSVVVVLGLLSGVLASCVPATPAVQIVKETVVVEKQVPVEKVVKETVEVEKIVKETVEVEKIVEQTAAVFGSELPYDRYVFIVQLFPGGGGGCYKGFMGGRGRCDDHNIHVLRHNCRLGVVHCPRAEFFGQPYRRRPDGVRADADLLAAINGHLRVKTAHASTSKNRYIHKASSSQIGNVDDYLNAGALAGQERPPLNRRGR